MDVFSPNDISRLRRPKKVKFGRQIASSTRIMRTLKLLEKVFNCGIFTKTAKNRPKMATSTYFSVSDIRDAK